MNFQIEKSRSCIESWLEMCVIIISIRLISGGEQQMLAMGRGLMGKPKLLLLDEPSLGLAPVIIEEIFQLIEDINHSGVTILIVEQDAQVALEISHMGYVLEAGKVAFSDSGKNLLHNEKVIEAYLGGKRR